MDEMVLDLVRKIECDPHADWSLESTAAMASYSPFHFHRIFKAVTGVTLNQFVRRRIMESAARMIILDERLEAVAQRLNYSSPEAFSRSFKGYVGVTPAAFRKRPVHVARHREVRALKMGKGRELSMKSKLLELTEPITVVGVQVQTNPPQDLNISTAWKGLTDKWTAIANYPANARVFGLEEYGADERNRSLGISYIACVEVSRTEESQAASLPAGTVKRIIPAGRYAVFTHVGPTETLDRSFRYVYSEGLAALGVTPHGEFDIEVYDDRFKEDDPSSELDIYVPVAGD